MESPETLEKSMDAAACYISSHPLLLFLYITILECQPHSGLGRFCSFQYPSLMAVGPRKRQFADTNNTSCPFVPCSAESLSLCPNPLSYLCRQQGPRLMNLLMFPGDYENQETSLRMI